MKEMTIGASEFEILAYIADIGEVTVRGVADHFAAVRGLARTTVLKTMDRLRDKGFLERRETNGVYVYTSTRSKSELEAEQIDRFVKERLGGSLNPFVAYLHGQESLDKEEIESLRKVVEDLDNRRKDR